MQRDASRTCSAGILWSYALCISVQYKHHVRSVLVGCYTLGCLSVSGLSSNTESAKIVKMNNKKEMVMQTACYEASEY